MFQQVDSTITGAAELGTGKEEYFSVNDEIRMFCMHTILLVKSTNIDIESNKTIVTVCYVNQKCP